MVYIKKAFLIVLGLTLVLIGILGVVLPLVHGTFFLLLGLVLLSFESKYIEHKLLNIVEKNKTARHWHKKVDTILRRWFGK